MYEYAAKVIKIVDGDTVDLHIDLGLETFVATRVRLYGINAPDYKEGVDLKSAATHHLTSLLALPGSEWMYQPYYALTVRTIKDKKEKYGRYLAQIWLSHQNPDTNLSINEVMVKDGFAVPYMLG